MTDGVNVTKEGDVTRVEIDTDVLSADRLAALLGVDGLELADGEPVAPDEAIDLEEFLGREVGEDEGVWCPIMGLRGGRVKLAHASNARLKFARLLRQYRKKHSVKREQDLDPAVEEALFCRAAFGDSVLDWDITLRDGSKFPFNLQNFAAMYQKSKKFRQSIEPAANLEEIAAAFKEEAGEV